ncbi:MAG TPA: NeuD/PglB/VioB family sugar acetyltransferase [Allosphingosinicella sp.]|nr:NeuD/PglB/VioB family sugar acetyltransferase [Allosphingosinicella sp.]
MKGRLVFYGAGGMGREMVQAARADARPKAFLSDTPAPAYPGIEPVGLADLTGADEICIAVGDPALRRTLAAKCDGLRFATVIAPTAIVDPSAGIGAGASICDFVMVNSLARIGRQFQANYYSHVSHDCLIGDFVTFSPRVSCLGTVEVGDGVFVGAGAVIRNGVPGKPLRIGEGAVIGMGAVVVADVPAGATVIGNPARIV